MITVRCSLALAAALLGGCMLGPNYHRPERVPPSAWQHAAQTSAPLPDDWWVLFGDAELTRHVTATLDANQDLAGALARYDQSRAALGVARADEFPQVTFDPVYQRGRTSAIVSNRFPTLETTLYRVPVDVAYEVDLWGRVRRSVEAAQADVETGAYSIAAFRLSLAAAAAAQYLSIRSTDRDIEILVQTLHLREDALTFSGRRANGKVESDLDVFRARAEVAQTLADLADAHRHRDALEHALAVLEARDAPDFHVPIRAQGPAVPTVPVALPSELLLRRPDVGAAERALQAASARIGVARTAFFPSVRLTASAGYASNDFGDLGDWSGRFWSIGPVIRLPLFEGGRNRARLQAAEAAYRGAYARWRQEGIVAFREVQDALSDIAWLSERGAALEQTVEASTAAARLTRLRYDRGLTIYFEVVNSERQLLASQRAANANDRERLIAALSLIKASGGGWQSGAAVPRQTATPASGSP